MAIKVHGNNGNYWNGKELDFDDGIFLEWKGQIRRFIGTPQGCSFFFDDIEGDWVCLSREIVRYIEILFWNKEDK